MNSHETSVGGRQSASVSITRSEEVDLELVQDIIDRAPRSATTFPQVYKAYGLVLEERGISPAADTAYYQFLLRLGVVRAPTWGEKWNLYLSSNSLLVHSMTRSAEQPSSDLTPDHSWHLPRPPAAQNGPARPGRIPFLASASSDLDLGFEADTVDEAIVVPKEGGSVIQHLRPSPRKALAWSQRGREQASLVGYPPDETIIDEIGDSPFDALPARTSTPLGHRLHQHDRMTSDEQAGPPLSPYFGSEPSASNTLGFEDGNEPHTPSAGHADLWEEDEPRIPGLDAWEEQEMLDKADRFYQTGLLGRCLDVWVNANDWISSTNAQIDSVRSDILLRQAIMRWRARLDRVLTLPGTADAHRRHHLQASALTRWLNRLAEHRIAAKEMLLQERSERRAMKAAWSRWRLRLVKNRTRRWQEDMYARESAFLKKRNQKLQRAVLMIWYAAFRDSQNTRVADQTYDRNVVTAVFVEWYHHALRKRTAEDRLDLILQRQNRDSLTRAFDVWSRRTRMVHLESAWAESGDKRLLQRTWAHWRVACVYKRQADDFYRQKEVKGAWTTWRQKIKRLRIMTGKSAMHAKRHDSQILRQTFELWMIRERGELLLKVGEQRSYGRILSRWREQLGVLYHKRAIAAVFRKNADQNRLHQYLLHWVRQHHERQDDLARADLVCDFKKLRGAFNIWQRMVQTVRDNAVKADGAAGFFTQRTAMKVWKASLARRRQEKALKARELAITREIFERWKWEAERAIGTRMTIAQYEVDRDKRSMAAMLHKWTARVIAIKVRDLDVKEHRDRRLMSRAMDRWLHETVRIKDQQSLALSFVEVKKQDLLCRVMKEWRLAAHVQFQHRNLGEQFAIQADRRALIAAFFAWQTRFGARQLAPIEEEVALRNEDALLFNIWDTWKAKATQLPAVSFRNSRLKRLAWTRWQVALENKRQIKTLQQRRDRELLFEILAVWRENARQRLSQRALSVRHLQWELKLMIPGEPDRE